MVTEKPSPAELVAKFFGAWNAESPAERRKLLEATCNQQTRFVSSRGEHMGVEAQLEAIAAFRRQYPLGRCSAQLLMEHHGWLLISWVTEFGRGRPPLRGMDAGLIGPNRRLTQMVSFSPVPSP
jgi:hypothetical protein